jgi:hypothetical protein
MTKSPDTPRHDLAADLLADLTQPVPIDTVFKSESPATSVGSPGPAAPQESRGLRPAVQWLVRISPLDWRRPSLSVARDSTAMRLGPIQVELALFRSAVSAASDGSVGHDQPPPG